MYLKRLEIQGFKSFARKTTLEFEKGITAIVGPNGSGKSNVADCLRWTLGEQSAKLMRGKKSDDVIFAGSDKKVRAGFAEVVATFDNRDHKIPVDTSEVSIGRRIDRSGESEYLINGQKVRLLDIVDLVLKSNIGTSRYTVIGQGTIDQMVLSGPAEIKNLLDEASGVKTYYLRREKTLRRLEQTAQNLMRAEDLVAEIEPRLKSLRRQAKRMEARSQFEQELKVLLFEWFGARLTTLNIELSGANEKQKVIELEKQKLEKEIAQFRNEIEHAQNSNSKEVSRYKELQLEIGALQDQKNKLLENLSLIRGKMESQKSGGAADPKTLEVEIHALNRKVTEIKSGLDGHEEELLKNQNQVTHLAELLREVNNKLELIYSALSSPNSLDLKAINSAILTLEESYGRFYDAVLHGSNIEELKAKAAEFNEVFTRFKTQSKGLFQNPEAAGAKMQLDLQDLLKQKDKLTLELNSAQVSVSKTAMTKEFLQRQLEELKQQELNLRLELKKATSGTEDEYWQSLLAEEKTIQDQLGQLGQSIQKVQASLQEFYKLEEGLKASLIETERNLRLRQDEYTKLRDRETIVQVEIAKIETQLSAVKSEMNQQLKPEEVSEVLAKAVQSVSAGIEEKISKLRHQLELIGGVDDLTLQEYQETEGRYTHLSSQIADLKKGMTDLREIIDELDEHIKVKFNEAFHLVNTQFEQYFRMLFNGGRAFLSVVKSSDEVVANSEELSEDDNVGDALRPEEKVLQKYEKGSSNVIGVDIKATPPGKKLSSIQALSGGERALTSIALLCSLLTCFPSPFVVLDEVDAALDEANTIRFGQILGQLSHQTQFITITHNRETMAQSNTIYGVTMGDDSISKLLGIKLEQAKIFAK